MPAHRLPAFQFYPADWLKDPTLRSVSLAARGLWIDLLCLMSESERRGYLQDANGGPLDEKRIARMTGCAPQTAKKLLRELEDCGVFSRTETEGIIYSRRMVRDEQIRQQNRANGSMGGNPALKRSDNPSDNRPSNRNPTPSTSSSTSSSLTPEEKSAPCRAATSVDDQTTNAANGKPAIPPPLQELIDGWNGLPEGTAPRVTKPNSKAISKGWEKVQRDPEARTGFADISKLIDTIRESPFLHGKSWFAFLWLFGKDKGGIQWNVCKIMERNYCEGTDTSQRGTTGQTSRTRREVQGQGDGESLDALVAQLRPDNAERLATPAAE